MQRFSRIQNDNSCIKIISYCLTIVVFFAAYNVSKDFAMICDEILKINKNIFGKIEGILKIGYIFIIAIFLLILPLLPYKIICVFFSWISLCCSPFKIWWYNDKKNLYKQYKKIFDPLDQEKSIPQKFDCLCSCNIIQRTSVSAKVSCVIFFVCQFFLIEMILFMYNSVKSIYFSTDRNFLCPLFMFLFILVLYYICLYIKSYRVLVFAETVNKFFDYNVIPVYIIRVDDIYRYAKENPGQDGWLISTSPKSYKMDFWNELSNGLIYKNDCVFADYEICKGKYREEQFFYMKNIATVISKNDYKRGIRMVKHKKSCIAIFMTLIILLALLILITL